MTIINNQKGGLREQNIFKSNNRHNPLITVITCVLNNEKYLQECLDSLKKQNYKNFEYIIIDGGSTDNTINIIKENENNIDFWISEKDEGIYDAFNKGMSYARGEFIGFLNSDDVYYSPKTLNYVNETFEKHKNADFIFGPVKKHWALLHGYKPWKIFFTWGFYTSHSTGFFIKLESAKLVGKYNLKYKFSSDYDYFFRMIVHKKLNGIGVEKDKIFGIFRRGGFSSRVKFIDHFKEEIQIRKDNKQNKITILLIIIYKSIRHARKLINL